MSGMQRMYLHALPDCRSLVTTRLDNKAGYPRSDDSRE
jgi:hypothetical protein